MMSSHWMSHIGDKLITSLHKVWYWFWQLKLLVVSLVTLTAVPSASRTKSLLLLLVHSLYHPATSWVSMSSSRYWWTEEQTTASSGDYWILWHDDEYLQRKKGMTTIYDKRVIIPRCVITVSTLWYPHYLNPYISIHLPGNQIQIPKSRWSISWLQVSWHGPEAKVLPVE